MCVCVSACQQQVTWQLRNLAAASQQHRVSLLCNEDEVQRFVALKTSSFIKPIPLTKTPTSQTFQKSIQSTFKIKEVKMFFEMCLNDDDLKIMECLDKWIGAAFFMAATSLGAIVATFLTLACILCCALRENYHERTMSYISKYLK